MQMISIHNTLDILVNSSVKQKLNLLLGHTYLANIFEVTEDGKVIIQIGDNKLIADSKIPLIPGEKIYVKVKENSNNLILLQLINDVDYQETEKNQQILFRNSIINTLEKLNIPIKEENIGISHKLIQYNLSVSNKNIHKVTNGLVNAGYQDSLTDINIIDKGVMLFSKGLPITNETMELVDFFKGNRGQVTEKITEIDLNLSKLLKTLENEFNIPESHINNLNKLQNVKDDILNLGTTTDENQNKLPDKVRISNDLLPRLNNSTHINENTQISEKINVIDELNINNEELISEQSKNIKTDIKETQNIGLPNSKLSNQEIKGTDNLINKIAASINQDLKLDNSINTPINIKDNTIINKISPEITQNSTSTSQQELIKSISILKQIVNNLILKFDPSNNNLENHLDNNLNNNLDNHINLIKSIANLVTNGAKNIDFSMLDKFSLGKEEIILNSIENMLVEKESSQNISHEHNNINRVLHEQKDILNQNFNELTKHFEAIKLYNSSINENNNNFYLLPLPIEVAGEKHDNKIYFWSKGNKNKKVDPDNMRIVFILNTQNLGLLKIDIMVVKRDVFAGIEVSNSVVKEKLDKYSVILKEQLSAINYGLKRISFDVKKEEIINSPPNEHFADADITTLDLRI